MKSLLFGLAILTSITSSADTRENPLAWKNPIKCTVINSKATTKTIMDVDIDDPNGMNEIMESKHTELKLNQQNSEYGVGRTALQGSYEVSLDDSYKVMVSVTIDPTMGPVSEGDEMFVNSFLIDKRTETVINAQFDKASNFSQTFDGTSLLTTNKTMMNNKILTLLNGVDSSNLKGRLTSTRVDNAMKDLLKSGALKVGTPWKIMVGCQTNVINE